MADAVDPAWVVRMMERDLRRSFFEYKNVGIQDFRAEDGMLGILIDRGTASQISALKRYVSKTYGIGVSKIYVVVVSRR